MAELETRLREWIASKGGHSDTGTLNCVSEIDNILNEWSAEPQPPLPASKYGLREHERKALLELADQLHEFGDREVGKGSGATPGAWSTEGWQLAGDLRKFIDRLDRTLRTANETLEERHAEIDRLSAIVNQKAGHK